MNDAHRPWPIPRDRPWVQRQAWLKLLFAHWPLPVDELRRVVPPELPLDLYEGQAWIGVVPFDLRMRMRAVPPVPGIWRFLELNVRTYVTLDGKPGVFFFSLDAGNPLAVAGARLMSINYYYAWLSMRLRGGWVEYGGRRVGGPAASFRGRYRPVGETSRPVPGTLVHFLTERYCLYTVDRRGAVARLEIHHPRWPLQQAEGELDAQPMVDWLGLRLPDTAPLLHYAERQDMVAWLPERVR